ncbi:MAG: glycosyltransferase family 4 protein [Thaumarchaeota archaeon]|nr:glycosyltransferase family 4 protein [Nitrososphaerota archaeon]
MQRFSPAIGGSEKSIESILDYLSNNHKITVFTTNSLELKSFWDPKAKKVGSFDNKKYEVKRFEIVTPSEIDRKMYDFAFPISIPGPFCPQMWEELANIGSSYDLVIATAYPYDHIIPAYIAAKNNKIPIIIVPHIHLQYPELYFTGLRLGMLCDADAIIVNTNVEKIALLKYKINDEKIKIIPPGLNMELWNRPKENIRVKLRISERAIIILSAGAKSFDKGTISLIDALKNCWNKKKDIELVLIGPSMPDYVEYVKKLEKKFLEHIHDLGVVSDEIKKNVFYDCDIFAMPSRSDSLGIVYLEAWACSKPVIGCNIEAIREVASDGIDSILVDFGNNSQLTKAIEKLANNKELREKLGIKGREKVLNVYDLKLLNQRFESLCQSLI